MAKSQQKQQQELADTQGVGVPAVIQERQQQVIEQVLGSAGGMALHNFPGSKQDQWRMIALAESGEIPGMDEAESKEIEVTYFYAHRVRIYDAKSGEYAEPIRVVLLDDDNKGIQFVSEGIAKSLSRIIQTFGMGPYTPPVKVRVRVIQTRNKFRTYTLVPA